VKRLFENPVVAGVLIIFATLFANASCVPRAELDARLTQARIEGARAAFSACGPASPVPAAPARKST
jgi:hypothetical protein